MEKINTEQDIAEGLAGLVAVDPRFVPVIGKAGTVPLRRKAPGFSALAEIIVSQMVSRASAEALWRRLDAHMDGVTPDGIAGLDADAARTIGLSTAKAATLNRLADTVNYGGLDLHGLCTQPGSEAMASLTAIKGVGPWTAEVYLLFCAGHGDIFPSGDVALQSAAGHAMGLDGRPTAKKLAAMAVAWSPFRSIAARLLWAYYANHMNREATPLARNNTEFV